MLINEKYDRNISNMKIIIDITYKNRPIRIYPNYVPSLRAEREGFLVVERSKLQWEQEQRTKE